MSLALFDSFSTSFSHATSPRPPVYFHHIHLLAVNSFTCSLVPLTRLWSLTQSASQYTLTFCTDPLKLDLTASWSIWLLWSWPFGDVHLYLGISLCAPHLCHTKRSWNTILSKALLTHFAFQSPTTKSMSCFGTSSTIVLQLFNCLIDWGIDLDGCCLDDRWENTSFYDTVTYRSPAV